MADSLPPGVERENALRNGGFTDDEIGQWKGQTADTLTQGGFSPQEVKDYFGTKDPDNTGLKRVAKANVAAAAPAPGEAPKPKQPHETIDASPKPVEAKDVWDAMAAAYGNSILQLAKNGEESPIQMPAQPTAGMHYANMAAGLVADSPFMAAGAYMAGPVGAFGVPAGIRATLTDEIRNGGFKDPIDFAKRAVSIGWDTAKGAATGLATEVTGGSMQVMNAFGSPLAQALTGTAMRMGAETAAMTTVSAALDGRLPKAQEFLDGAIAIGGLHAVGYGMGKTGYVADKLLNIYKETGAHPAEVLEAVNQDPALKGELLSQNPDLPKEAGNLPAVKEDSLPAEPGEPEKPNDKSDAVKEVLSRVGEKAVPEEQSLKDKIKDGFNTAYANRLDYTKVIGDVLKEVGKDDIDGKNAQVLMRLHAAVQDKIQGFIEDATRDFHTGDVNGESLKNIVDDYKEKTGDDSLDGLKAYGIAARTIELAGRDIKQKGGAESGDLNSPDRKVLEELAHVQPFFNRLVEYKNRTLDYLAASGRYSEESVAAMKEMNKRYISFKKIIEPDPLTGEGPRSTKELKEIGDSDKQLQDPILSTVQDVASMIKLAHETEATNAFIDAVHTPDAVKENLIGDGQLQIEGEAGEPAEKAENPFIRRAEDQSGRASQTQIAGYENGKRTLYDVPPEVAEAIRAMSGNKPAMTIWTTLLKPFATGLRLGSVYNPLFAFRHAWRNQMTAPTLSATGLKPFEALLYAPEFLMKGDSYKQFIYDGGGVNSIIPLGKDYVDGAIYKLDNKAPFLSKAWNTLKTMGSFSHAAIVLNDNMIRYAEYQRSIESGQTREQAAYAGREVLPDFQRAGLKKSALQSITAFLNVHAQGIARAGEEAFSNPAGYIAKNLAYITVPSLLLSAANHGDDALDDIPNWQKYNYWTIHGDNWRDSNSLAEAMSVKSAYPSNYRKVDGRDQVNDGEIFRIQKPFTNGVMFGSMIEASIDAWKKQDPAAFGDFVKTVAGTVMAEPIPTALNPAIEQMTNRSFYTGQPLIRQSMENKLPEMQYDSYTSETAKILGKLVSYVPLVRDIGPADAKLASPKVIDNYMHAWSGTLGNYAISALDEGLRTVGLAPKEVKPTDTLSDIPFVKEFMIRFPNAHPQSVADFEDRYKQADRVTQSIKMMMKQGDVKGAMDIQDRYQINMERLTGVDKAIQNMNSAIQKVNQTPDIDPVQKRQLIDSMMYQMTSMAKEGNILMDQFKKRVKTKEAGN